MLTMRPFYQIVISHTSFRESNVTKVLNTTKHFLGGTGTHIYLKLGNKARAFVSPENKARFRTAYSVQMSYSIIMYFIYLF
jgi:hypothetical protein